MSPEPANVAGPHYVAAFTEPTVPNSGYVGYVSIYKKYVDDQFIDITVRQRGTGAQASITMTREAFALLLTEAQKNI